MKDKGHIADSNDIAIGEGGGRGGDFIEGAAVGAVEIGKMPMAILQAQLGVAGGNRRVLDWDICIADSADKNDLFLKFVGLAGIRTGLEGDAVIHERFLLDAD